MIKRLLFKNFQKHKKLDIELDPYVTTITGATDAGKSSLIRGLRWLALNKPRGDKFKNRKCKKVDAVVVKAMTEKGIVSRERSSKKNSYRINKQTLEAFGNEVPEEVQAVLAMTELNFEFQHTAPYWFSKSAGEISKELNSIVDLSIIDEALTECAGRIRKAKAEISVYEERVATATVNKEQLEFIVQAEKDYKKIEHLRKRIDEEGDKINALSHTITSVQTLVERSARLRQAQTQGEELLQIAKKLDTETKKCAKLRSHIEVIERLERKISTPIPDISEIDKLITLTKNNGKLKQIINRIESLQETICQSKKELKSERKNLENMMGESCPLCGQAIE